MIEFPAVAPGDPLNISASLYATFRRCPAQALAQTQGMPGYVNQVRYVFERTGTYRVLCLEFCGIAHHDMIGQFDVVASEG